MMNISLNLDRPGTLRAVCGRDLKPLPRLAPEIFAGADRVCLVTDTACLRIFRKKFKKMLGRYWTVTDIFILPDGLRAKTFGALEKLLAFMLKSGCSRKSVLLAAGGGSVTDLAGLAAALYMRGIGWISVPTTLLGQIDAGLGGKTAVDLNGVKNVAGAFYQPTLTVCDAAFLKTLTTKERDNATGELLKYSLLGPEQMRNVILKNIGAELKTGPAVERLVAACAAFKLALTARDERDSKGQRETLNLGHTAGHAFETISKGRLPHGQAVLWGLRYAYLLSTGLGVLEYGHRTRVRDILWDVKIRPLAAGCFNFKVFNSLISRDKKNGANKNRFLLIKRPGTIVAANNIHTRHLQHALHELKKYEHTHNPRS